MDPRPLRHHWVVDRGGLRLTSRGRERAWWLLAVAIVAAVLVALITKVSGASVWIQLTCLAVGTGLGLLVVELRARGAQDDKTLTAGNARQRGYEFVCDVLPEFVEENRELLASLRPEGCVLGEASAGNRDEALGLYQPLQRTAT